MSYTVSRLRPFGESIFAQMSAKAAAYDCVNLGQGFPDEDGPASMLEVAQEAIRSGKNQYAPGRGIPQLRAAICKDREARYGITYDPATECLVTVGATEAIAASILGLVEPNKEVIVFEPYYDAYVAAIALAGAKHVSVPLCQNEDTWGVDEVALRAAVTPNTAMIVVNTPHNPTGSVFNAAEMEAIARVACDFDLLVLCDEVYEHLVFDEAKHLPMAKLSGMRERTVTVSSAAKSLNVTGWKTGWVLASPELIEAVLYAKQFMSFVGATPMQYAVAHGVEHEQAWIESNVARLRQRRDLLAKALADAGFRVARTDGTYFIAADIAGVTDLNGAQFCLQLPKQYGIAAIPMEAFADEPGSWRSYVRFAFCKRDDVLAEAVQRLRRFAKSSRTHADGEASSRCPGPAEKQ